MKQKEFNIRFSQEKINKPPDFHLTAGSLRMGVVNCTAAYMHWDRGASTAREVSELTKDQLESLLKTPDLSIIFDVNGKAVGISKRNLALNYQSS